MPTVRTPLDGDELVDGHSPFYLGAFLRGVIAAGLVILVLALLQGLALAFTNWPALSDRWLRVLNLSAIGVGAVVTGRRTRRLGWLHGLAVGVLYAILVAWWVGYGIHIFSPPLVTWLVLAFLVGALGGMVGSATQASQPGGGRWR
ncbi:MAG: TIGR04086 family membrane protein [Limnochordaceae bacterium]|nr:TIGR04086 family membrane protein [Limnochordaceae bacterium]